MVMYLGLVCDVEQGNDEEVDELDLWGDEYLVMHSLS